MGPAYGKILYDGCDNGAGQFQECVTETAWGNGRLSGSLHSRHSVAPRELSIGFTARGNRVFRRWCLESLPVFASRRLRRISPTSSRENLQSRLTRRRARHPWI